MRETPMQKADRRRRLFGRVLGLSVGLAMLAASIVCVFLLPRNQWGYVEGIYTPFSAMVLGAGSWGGIWVSGRINTHFDPPIPYEQRYWNK